jgi:hypothetical protein
MTKHCDLNPQEKKPQLVSYSMMKIYHWLKEFSTGSIEDQRSFLSLYCLALCAGSDVLFNVESWG